MTPGQIDQIRLALIEREERLMALVKVTYNQYWQDLRDCQEAIHAVYSLMEGDSLLSS